MAELLIYDTVHWMDRLSTENWTALRAAGSLTDAKYLRRWQRGHVVAVEADGFFTDPKKGRGWDRATFRLLCLPGVSVAQATAQYLADGLNERRRYTVLTGANEKTCTVPRASDVLVRDNGLAPAPTEPTKPKG